MVTCHQTGRVCFAMDLDPKFCQVTLERMLALDPDLPVFKNGELMEVAALAVS